VSQQSSGYLDGRGHHTLVPLASLLQEPKTVCDLVMKGPRDIFAAELANFSNEQGIGRVVRPFLEGC
jgi:hypothetical protein